MDLESQLESRLIADTDRCVLCNLCLPYCPTYALTKSEAESPRGRISLIKALSEHKLEPTDALVRHLDNCLGCRACERACPSGVPYGRIIAEGRHLLVAKHAESGDAHVLDGFIGRALTGGKGPGAVRAALRAYQATGLQTLARATGLMPRGLSRLDELLPELPRHRALKEVYPAKGEEVGTVALFTGCTGEAWDQDALHAAIFLLNACGYSVQVPQDKVCCGALHRNAGNRQKADELARKTVEVYGALDADAIVGIATGCGAALVEYGDMPDADEAVIGFARRVKDITDFLGSSWPETLLPAPLAATVAIHEPCSLTNVLRKKGLTLRLLEHIPELRAVSVGRCFCCGAAGTYTLNHPETADALGNDILREVAEYGASVLVSANVGCALHLGGLARRAGLTLRVIHPVVILAQQLQERYK